MNKREEGQSQESADALAQYMLFVDDLSVCASEVHRCKHALMAARKSYGHAREAEIAALAAYEAVPYGEE